MDQTQSRLRKSILSVMKYVYWIVGLLGVGLMCYYIYNVMARPVAGILVFIGGFLALYFYYVKWFIVPSKRSTWPPYQTTCPDYLTPIVPGTKSQSGKIKCVDFVGVSKTNDLKVANPASVQQQIRDPQYYVEIDPNASEAELKSMLAVKGLSWVSLFGDD